jgi:hypothetical protein
LERTAINGTTIPGILGKAGIGNVALGDNGGLPEWVDILSLEAAIDAAFADMNNLKVLTTPYVKAYLKAKEKATNTGKFIWVDMSGVITYPGYTTTLVPATLTKGTATSTVGVVDNPRFTTSIPTPTNVETTKLEIISPERRASLPMTTFKRWFLLRSFNHVP